MKMSLKHLIVTYVAAVSASCPLETEVTLDTAVEKIVVSDYDVKSINRFVSEIPVSSFRDKLFRSISVFFFSINMHFYTSLSGK